MVACIGGGFKDDILPILQNLTHLLSQNERKIDRYDAQALFDLEHTLGMAWQMPEKLKTLKNLKQVISPACPRHKDLLGNYDPISSKAWRLAILTD